MNSDTRLAVIEYAVKLEGDPLQHCYKWQLINMMCGRWDLGQRPSRGESWIPYAVVGGAAAFFLLLHFTGIL